MDQIGNRLLDVDNAFFPSSIETSSAIIQLLSDCHHSIDACVDSVEPTLGIGISELVELITVAIKRGVKVRYLTQITRDNLSYCKRIAQQAELRHLNALTGEFVVIDHVHYVATTRLSNVDTIVQGIYGRVPHVVQQQQFFFENLWERADKAEHRLVEIENQIESAILVLADPFEIQKTYLSLLESSNTEIQLILPTQRTFGRQQKLGVMKLLEDSAKRGVSVKILSPLGADNITLLDMNASGIETRIIQGGVGPPTCILVVDRSISFLIEIGNDKPEDFVYAVSKGIYTKSSPTVSAFASFFDSFWKEAGLSNRLRLEEKLKAEFINIAAHELRTPIQPIMAAVDLLEPQFVQSQDKPALELIALIRRNSTRLEKLASDILSVARLDSGNFGLQIEEANLIPVINKVIEDINSKYSHRIRNRRSAIRFDRQSVSQQAQLSNDVSQENILQSLIEEVIGSVEDNKESQLLPRIILNVENRPGNSVQSPNQDGIIARFDVDKITEVFFNLLDNAMKFATKGGRIVVTIRDDSDLINITVKDDGPGIDPSVMDSLFEKFVSASENGTGLGLYIVKKILTMHGGLIYAENNSPEAGATFAISLPFSPYSRRGLDVEDENYQVSTIYDDNTPTRGVEYSPNSLDAMRKTALERIENTKARLVSAREEAVRIRNVKLEEFQSKVEQSRRLLTARQELLNQQVKYNKTRRKVDSRIEKGLEGLQRLIESLRENLVGESPLDKLTLHPLVISAQKREAKKVIASEFFKSIQTQLSVETRYDEKS